MSLTALLVGAAGSPRAVEVITRAAGGCDIRVGIDGGAAALIAAGRLPDIVIGDLDSLDARIAEDLRSRGVEFRTYPSDKDVTDLDLALDWCRNNGVSDVVAVDVWGRRADHSLAALGSLARSADLRPLVMTGAETIFVASSHHRSEVRELQTGDIISVLAMPPSATVSITGTRWVLDTSVMQPLSSLGVSNQVIDPDAAVTVHEGTVLVFVTRHDGRPG